MTLSSLLQKFQDLQREIEKMGEMASLWGYAEQHQDMDQLGQKLLYTTLELEKLKSETMEEMQKNKDYVNQLIDVLKCTLQERDEAKNQLEKLINKTTFPHFQSECPVLKPLNPNSSITESNNLSETYNYGSPPVDSLFDPLVVSSPDLFHRESNIFDRGSMIIESLVKGRVLPQKGMFLQAVIEAGPLLQTLLLAGPLPRWRNPPQLQAFQIPPVSIRGGDVEVLGQKPNFGCVRSNNDCFHLAKRQRFC